MIRFEMRKRGKKTMKKRGMRSIKEEGNGRRRLETGRTEEVSKNNKRRQERVRKKRVRSEYMK